MPLDVSLIRALCFDVDGTLSDTDDLYTAALAQLLVHVPLVRDAQRTARRMIMWTESPGNALLGAADTLGVDGPMIAAIDWIYRHRRRQPHPFSVVEGVPDLLRRLHNHYPLAVVSARDAESTHAFLVGAKLAACFDVVVTALTAEHTKPYPDPILYAAQKMSVSPSTCVMIGDTTVDIRAGRAAGAQTVGVLCGFGESAELRRQGADLILPSTADLAEFLLDPDQSVDAAMPAR